MQTLLFKKSVDDVIGTPQSACEATLQYQYHIDTFKENNVYSTYYINQNCLCMSPLNALYVFRLNGILKEIKGGVGWG